MPNIRPIYVCQQKNSIYQILILLLKQNMKAVPIKPLQAPGILHVHDQSIADALVVIFSKPGTGIRSRMNREYDQKALDLWFWVLYLIARCSAE